jgi:hypothetical protein
MNPVRARRTLTLAAAAASLCLLLPAPAAAKLSKGDARKLIAALSLFELNSGAVTIKEIRSTETEATVLAGVRSAFRFARGEDGNWRAAEVRVGDRQWEDFDLIPAVAGAGSLAAARAALDALAGELEGRARERGRGGKGAGDKDAGDEVPLVRGPLRVEKPAAALSALGSSAVLEAEIEASFEFARERGRWRVALVRLGAETLADFDALTRSLNQVKAARARADLDALASALEAHRRARGFYVAVDTGSALNDHLSPRYLPAPVRFDPWHRPYEYEGTPTGYVLRSLGPDGKPNTPDDVTIRK